MSDIDVMTHSTAASERANSPDIGRTIASNADVTGDCDGDSKDEGQQGDQVMGIEKDEIRFGNPVEPFFFLSNSFPAPIALDGIEFPNAEAIFQTSKFEDAPDIQRNLIKTESLADHIAKAQIWAEEVSNTWASHRMQVMKEVLLLKFTQHRQLRERLLQTGTAELIYELKTDYYWATGHDDSGSNHLGRLLTTLRRVFEVKEGQDSPLSSIALTATQHSRTTNSALIWAAGSIASERWYPSSGAVLQTIRAEPSIATAAALEPFFLHGLAHGPEPWTLAAIVEEHEGVKTAIDLTPWAKKTDNSGDSSDALDTCFHKTYKGKEGVLYRAVHFKLRPNDDDYDLDLSGSTAAGAPLNSRQYHISVRTTKT
ncbi:hypothetical protein OC835_004379 [Tilletia horrida]|nr:hypothetical protein OC835_004379 [Tilletia horrida]